MVTRRQFLKAGTFTGAGALMLRARGWPFNLSPTGIPKFDATLPGLGPGGANNFGNYIPVLSPDTTAFPGTDYYQIAATQFRQILHPSISGEEGRGSRFWGYADALHLDSKYLGGVIIASSGRPVKLRVTNLLPTSHILPVDFTAIDEQVSVETGKRVDRIVTHLHGGLVQWTSDGGPFAWFSNANNPGGFVKGSSFVNGDGLGAAIHDYPNDQSARLLWYHDHAYGLTRANAYAGIVSAYLIIDAAEAQLISSGILPNLGGLYTYGIPLIIQDKSFWNPRSDPRYSAVVSGAHKGDLWYPHVYESPGTAQPLPSSMLIPPSCDGTGRWDWLEGSAIPPSLSLVPEFFSDTILVNGAPYPKLRVAPRRYRFRVLNGSQGRFYNLQFYVGDGSADSITLRSSSRADPNGNPVLVPTNPPGPRVIQIGTEGGLLPNPVVLNDPPRPIGYFRSISLDPRDGNVSRYTLLLAPAERADIIVDFRGFEGQEIILYNDAPAPFPGGDIRNDYYPGAADLTCIGGAPTPNPGRAPDTRILMKFVVSSSGSVSELSFDQTLNALSKALPATFRNTQPTTKFDDSSARNPKVKTLNEDFDLHGRLLQRLGSPEVANYLDAPTEIVSRGEVQFWQIYNLTADTHPMHFHLVNVALIKREGWKFDSLGNAVVPLSPIPGTAVGPDPNERGWKDTVRMNPGEVITVAMRFDMPTGAPPSPRLQASYGITGAEYVWHCHIIEHEEHDMMRPLVVV